MSKGLVVITGASAGFGEATALSFAKLGYSLALGARRVEKLRAVAQACEKAGAPRVLSQSLDVTELESVQAFAKAAGTPEILVNNAGLARGRDGIDKLNDADIVAMVDTNVTGLLRVTEIDPGMAETEFSVVRLGDTDKAKKVYEGWQPLSAQDVADTIVWVATRPLHVNVSEVVLMGTAQASLSKIHKG